MGDLGNITSGEGKAAVDISDGQISLTGPQSIIGRSLVVSGKQVAKVRKKQHDLMLVNITKAAKNNAVSSIELEKNKNEAKIAAISVEMELFELQIKENEYEEAFGGPFQTRSRIRP